MEFALESAYARSPNPRGATARAPKNINAPQETGERNFSLRASWEEE